MQNCEVIMLIEQELDHMDLETILSRRREDVVGRIREKHPDLEVDLGRMQRIVGVLVQRIFEDWGTYESFGLGAR